MNTLKQFKEEMNWNTETWTNEQLEKIYNDLVNDSSFDDIEQLDKDEYYNEYDFSFTYDVNLSSLLSDLTYSGLSVTDIMGRLTTYYGNVIDLYYLKTNDVYCMVIGVR